MATVALATLLAPHAFAQKPNMYKALNLRHWSRAVWRVRRLSEKARLRISQNLKAKPTKGRVISLKNLSKMLFKTQFKHRAYQKLVGKKAGIIGKVREESSWQETDEILQLATSTAVTINDPTKLRANWPRYKQFMKGQKRSKLKTSDVKKMPKSFLKALAQYKKELKKLPKSDPLRKALAKGDAA